MPDFLIADYGSIVWIVPVSPGCAPVAGRECASEPWQSQGGALSVEHCCAGDLIKAIEAAGFDISR
jgi:hypothetical protein